MSSSAGPTKFSHLLDFVSARKEALSNAPHATEVGDFANGCHQTFLDTYADSHVRSHPILMTMLLHLTPLMSMEEFSVIVSELENKYAILSAPIFADALVGADADNITLNIEPLENIAMSRSKFNTNTSADPGFGQHIPEALRGYVAASVVNLCCILSLIWGFFVPHETPTVQHVIAAVNNFAENRLPTDPAEQITPLCSPRGMIVGWNTAMVCVEDVFHDRLENLRNETFDEDKMKRVMQSICRASMSMTATNFFMPVRDWTLANSVIFTTANTAFNSAFLKIVDQIAPQDDDDVQLNFSLMVDTAMVRPVRPAPDQTLLQQNSDPHGKSLAARTLNVSTAVLEMLQLQRAAADPTIHLNKRRRLAAVTNPPPPPPPPDQPPLTEAQRARFAAVAEERRKMRIAAARRAERRVNNAGLTVEVIWDLHHYDIRALQNVLSGRGSPLYEFEDPDSENDEIAFERERADQVRQNGNIELRIEMEILMILVVNNHVDAKSRPPFEADDSIIQDYGTDGNSFLHRYLRVNSGMFLKESTRALNTEQFADHHKAVLHMETHFQLQRELFQTFPKMIRTHNPNVIAEELMGRDPDHRLDRRFTLRVNNVANTRMLIDLVCTPYSANHNVRASMVQSFPGQTVCAAIFMSSPRARTNTSPLTFVIVRSISHTSEPTAIDARGDAQLDDVKVKITASRLHLGRWNIAPDTIVYLIPFCNIVTNFRTLKAIHRCKDMPDSMQQIFFGASFEEIPKLPEKKIPRSRAELEAGLQSLADVKARMNQGCLQYVESVAGGERCDRSQERALCTTLAEMGEMLPNSNSLSMILGPPGCGKSSTIALLCMALLHHSNVGHFQPGVVYPTVLPNPPGDIRCSNNRDGLRILVTCSSNFGADEVARKLTEQLPMGDGSARTPYIVRIARYNYDFADLEEISLHHLALQYDLQVYNPPPEGAENPELPRNPTMTAIKALVREACIFVCTNATACGPLLHKIGVSVSAVIVDEASHAAEYESLMPITANMNLAQDGRVHVVLVGDTMQLGPVFVCSHDAINFVTDNRKFIFNKKMVRQFESLFERLYRTDRSVTSWLTYHYRTHPELARIVHSFMYKDILQHPLPLQHFQRPFNHIDGAAPLRPLTIIDTRMSLSRIENRDMTNELEAEIINDVLWTIFEKRGNANLNNDIIVTSPYVRQTNFLQQYLTTGRRFASAHPTASGVRITVDTVDACQGSERSIAVISLTRSNRAKKIGFLMDNRRLNVAFTRARHMLVVVGDFSTMSASRIANTIYKEACNGAPGTTIQFYTPATRDTDEHERRFARRVKLQLNNN